ncbi:ERF family protein [Chryseobacterium lathyri]|uniref:Single-stranded DNA-binding protein n=1 Tax=Chryseobacterium lathyri TaxID=395933 RepID=A0A511YFY5_9FLAO|nr:ERF family protein [Chryseobacterium lathyri]GEN74117.1 hypothetical protein CLA01_41890 [Chryseobacterium lathyri]
MEKSTNPKLYKAIINVMKSVKNIDKSLDVGTGNTAYKGVADKDVKSIIGKAMEDNGLAILPISISPNVRIERWEETTHYQGKPQTKMKQSVFTEVSTKYLLIHESGECIEIEGYGHGVDSQDKSAGKATTYALKYALLYTFMVPTGTIDDADNKHSDNLETPPVTPVNKTTPPPLKILKVGSKAWQGLIEKTGKGETVTREELRKFFDLKEVEQDLESLNIF